MNIHQYHKKCFKEYQGSIRFPKETTYLYGNPVQTVMPLQTAIGKVMVIGPHPAARLYFLDNIPDVPLYDSNAPFATDPYYDGSRVRNSLMGEELVEVILETLGVKEEDCWLTTLVKVFLFDSEHVKKYRTLGKEIVENKSKYMEFANRSISWIRQEIEMANPYAVVLMGEEVISSLLLVSGEEARQFMTGKAIEKKIIWKNTNFICLPRPGLLLDRSARNPWPRKFAVKIGPTAAGEVERLKSEAGL